MFIRGTYKIKDNNKKYIFEMYTKKMKIQKCNDKVQSVNHNKKIILNGI